MQENEINSFKKHVKQKGIERDDEKVELKYWNVHNRKNMLKFNEIHRQKHIKTKMCYNYRQIK